jgi:hypothetical protein
VDWTCLFPPVLRSWCKLHSLAGLMPGNNKFRCVPASQPGLPPHEQIAKTQDLLRRANRLTGSIHQQIVIKVDEDPKAAKKPSSKNPPMKVGFLTSWGTGIRTPISTSRAWRAAVAPFPKATGILPLNSKLVGKIVPSLWDNHLLSLVVFQSGDDYKGLEFD